MIKKLAILFVILLLSGAVVAIAITGAVLPWSVTRNRQPGSPDTNASPMPTTITSLPAITPVVVSAATPPAPTTAVAEPSYHAPVCFTVNEIMPGAFVPGTDWFAVRASKGMQIFDLKTGALVSVFQASENVVSAAVSPNGQDMAIALDNGTIQLIKIADQKILASLIGHPDPVYDLLFSPTGDRLYSASHAGVVRIWDLTGKQVSAIDTRSEIMGIGVSPEGTMLATIPFDGPVSLWELAGNTKIAELVGTGGYDTSEAYFSPDGQYLAADLAGGIYLWRISDSSLVWNAVKNSMAVTFSPDGRYLAYSDIDQGNLINLVTPDASRVIRSIGLAQSPVWELSFSPDGSRLEVTDGIEIRIWNVADGSLLSIGRTVCP